MACRIRRETPLGSASDRFHQRVRGQSPREVGV